MASDGVVIFSILECCSNCLPVHGLLWRMPCLFMCLVSCVWSGCCFTPCMHVPVFALSVCCFAPCVCVPACAWSGCYFAPCVRLPVFAWRTPVFVPVCLPVPAWLFVRGVPDACLLDFAWSGIFVVQIFLIAAFHNDRPSS